MESNTSVEYLWWWWNSHYLRSVSRAVHRGGSAEVLHKRAHGSPRVENVGVEQAAPLQQIVRTYVDIHSSQSNLAPLRVIPPLFLSLRHESTVICLRYSCFSTFRAHKLAAEGVDIHATTFLVVANKLHERSIQCPVTFS